MTTPKDMLIRPVVASDYREILALNTAFVEMLSPLDAVSLEALHSIAIYFRIAEIDGEVAAFLLALAPGKKYESLNYRWFDQRSNDFIYIDRIVVAAARQGQALGLCLYKDLEAFAIDGGYQRLVCEYYCEPKNIGSAKFHKKYGFTEVGHQAIQHAGKDASKRVSMQSLVLAE